MIQYKTTTTVLFQPCLGRYTAFGIDVLLGGRRIAHIPDVFLVRDKADRLVTLCNTLQLDPIHLADVIEDTL